VTKSTPVVAEQIKRAGVRLAAVLNLALKERSVATGF
jgi:hypothetical protein